MSLLHEISEVIGSEKVIRLGLSLGGIRIYIPQKVGINHLLTSVLGQNTAQTLCNRCQGETINIPSKKTCLQMRNQLIIREYHALGSEDNRAHLLALKYELSRYQILRIVHTPIAA